MDDKGHFKENPVVGYGISADPWSWRVMLIKVRETKDGQKQCYQSVLGYFKSLQSATDFIVNHASSMHYMKNEKGVEDIEPSNFNKENFLIFKDLDQLKESLAHGLNEAKRAVDQFEKRVIASGYKLKDFGDEVLSAEDYLNNTDQLEKSAKETTPGVGKAGL